MFVVSNAMLSQVEIAQRYRWDRGPLELVFFDANLDGVNYPEIVGMVSGRNRGYEGGFLRDGGISESLTLPGRLFFNNPEKS